MSYVALRREEEKERRRAEMIDAAEALYAELGWDAVTMEGVARKARLSRALLYVYFHDKNDLLCAVTERALTDLRERFEKAAASHDTGIDKVRAIGRAYVLFQQEKPWAFDACTRFNAHQGEGVGAETACAAAGDAVLAVLVQALLHGQADGSIRKDLGPPIQVAVMLWAFTHGLVQVATSKAREIARQGVDVPQLMEGSFDKLRYMLAARPGH